MAGENGANAGTAEENERSSTKESPLSFFFLSP
jgi:hypothetical protein